MNARLGLGRYLLDDQPARLCAEWTGQLAAGRTIPAYGSADWLHAPRDLQIAAMMLAGEAHRREQLFLPQALADQLEAEQRLIEQQDQAEWNRTAAAVRAMGAGEWATHAQLQTRRAQPRRPFAYQPAPWPADQPDTALAQQQGAA